MQQHKKANSSSLPLVHVGACTHVGQRRQNNQDFMGYLKLEEIPYPNSHLCIVADGMGGANGGEVASQTAVETLLQYFREKPNLEPDIALKEAVELASQAILKQAKANSHLTGMGTTCVVIFVQNGWLFAAHVGDSRIYMCRDGVLHRLTRDHSNVQRLVEAGYIDEKRAENHPGRNILSRVLGSEHDLHVELLAPPWKLRHNDKVLLCSDGLHGEVSDYEIGIVLNELPAQAASEKLVELANKAGGSDNITVQIMHYENPSEESMDKNVLYVPEESMDLYYLIIFFVGGITVFLTGYCAALLNLWMRS